MDTDQHIVAKLAPSDSEWRETEKARHEARREAARRGMAQPEKWLSGKLLNMELERQARDGLNPEPVVSQDVSGTEWEHVAATIEREDLRREVLEVLPPYIDGGSPRPIGYGATDSEQHRSTIREAFARGVQELGVDQDVLERAKQSGAAEKRRSQAIVGSLAAELAKHWSMEHVADALEVPTRTLFRWRTKSGTNPPVT